jgi:hypothetical protein
LLLLQRAVHLRLSGARSLLLALELLHLALRRGGRALLHWCVLLNRCALLNGRTLLDGCALRRGSLRGGGRAMLRRAGGLARMVIAGRGLHGQGAQQKNGKGWNEEPVHGGISCEAEGALERHSHGLREARSFAGAVACR